jgi:hypothetical protein
LQLVSSDALLLEIGFIPEKNRKDDAYAILKIAKQSLDLTPEK